MNDVFGCVCCFRGIEDIGGVVVFDGYVICCGDIFLDVVLVVIMVISYFGV